MTETDQDQQLVCQECGQGFVFTQAEADFYRKKSLCVPKRCKACRGARARSAPSEVRYPTGDPNEYRSPMACGEALPSWGRAGNRQASGAGHQGTAVARGPRRSHPRAVYAAICAKCGATAHVPFEPNRNREVLCRGCYAERRGLAAPEDSANSDS